MRDVPSLWRVARGTVLGGLSSSWHEISRHGESRAVRSSFLWLIATPLLARLFLSLEDPIVLGTLRVPKFSLPFSWVVFYFAAVAFSVANVIYRATCPRIVPAFRDYSDFTRSGRGRSELAGYLPTDRATGWNHFLLALLYRKMHAAASTGKPVTPGYDAGVDYRKLCEEALWQAPENQVAGVFWALHSTYDHHLYERYRRWCMMPTS
jgi:hypothetical protein